MIDAENFVEVAREYGFSRYTGVPCSYLTPFINYVINDKSLAYVSSANEGDAVATAAGAYIGGEGAVAMMQNSGLGNAINPLTSLTHVFRIPILLITTHRGAAGLADEPQHALMGEITGDLLNSMHIPWENFPAHAEEIKPAMERAREYMEKQKRPYCFVMQKGTVRKHELTQDQLNNSKKQIVKEQVFNKHVSLPTRNAALRKIIDACPENNSVLIATTGYTGRELYAINDRKNQLYMVGSMGCAPSLGLGLALSRPDLKIIVIDGDGAALMRMGNFSTIGSYAPANLVHILLDNEVHDSTGAQSTVSAGVNFIDIAGACGYPLNYAGNELQVIDTILSKEDNCGPIFAHIKIQPGTIDDLPRPSISPENCLSRLIDHINQ